MTSTVLELWRYPVKSMQGEELEQLDLVSMGVVGDRRFGVFDPASGYLLTAKTVPALLEAGARTDGDLVVITLPDGTEIGSSDPGASTALSRWLGREVELRESGAPEVSFELTFDPPDDDAALVECPALLGTLLDLAPVHVLTTASLARMASAHPDGQWDVRRFRPNVLVDTGDAEGFVEDEWVGGVVPIGDGGAALHIGAAAIRCAMPLRAQPAVDGRAPLTRDVRVHHALMAEHANHLGVYCGVTSAGSVQAGDEVCV